MTWHLDSQQLADYAAGRSDHATAMSVEAHLLGCPDCRGRVPTDETWLTAHWAELRDIVDRPRPGFVERLLTQLGVSEATARLLVATPHLYRTWLLAMVVVLGGALYAAYELRHGTLLFLATAPALPLMGVAVVYGRAVDPAHEFATTAPMSGHRLLLVRAVAVLAPSLTLCSLVAALLPAAPGWSAVGWLLPALVLAIGSLTLARWWPPPIATGLLGGAWFALLGTVSANGPRGAAFVLFSPGVQAGYAVLLALVVAAYILMPRRA